MIAHPADDSIAYDETRYFTRGRSGYHADPEGPSGALDLVVALALGIVGVLVIGAFVFGIVHALLPAVG